MKKLSNTALLVVLNISLWTGRKKDRKATETVARVHSTKNGSGNFTKKLLPGAKELQAIQSLGGALRKFYYAQTLPWMADGARIIKADYYLTFMDEFRPKKIEFENAVAEFLRVYPSLRQDAKSELGDLFSDSDYPVESRLFKKFACEVSCLPIPEVQDFRVELMEDEKKAFAENMKKVESGINADLVKRLREVVDKAVEVLNKPDAIFRDTLLDNIQEVCSTVQKLNVLEDATLEGIRQDASAIIAKTSPDTCRENSQERENTAKALKEIQDKMAAFMGQGEE